jgi:hypothetical protein
MAGINHTWLRWLAAAALALPLLACGRTSHVGAVTAQAAQLDGKTVTVTGQVKEVGQRGTLRYFVLDDGTGQVTIIGHPTPRKVGEQVRITGQVLKSVMLAGRSTVAIQDKALSRLKTSRQGT